MAGLELWGGVECTVNRVGDRYFDQLDRTGHVHRLDDIARFAALGITTLRLPALWERLAPNALDDIDWSWTDAVLTRCRELGVRPIAGLVHHGSGPRYTSLLDQAFPKKLAAYARAFAQRYPWVDAYTPINEPLTTARFSGLYGLWYPHGRDALTFLRILLNELRATVLAMREIRTVNARAQCVQTEDLGRVYSTPKLLYQAEFENERRWLGFDVLMGRLGPDHALYNWMLKVGIGLQELAFFERESCPPDILGINHYITSNRFLDERISRYPPHCHGGNGRERYADIEAVRVEVVRFESPASLLRDAWERYRLPIAVTEVHMGCTRDEQMRWLVEMWNAARTVASEVADVRALTAWSLLGAYDWDSLVTLDRGHYEPGAFDLRGGAPRPTALCDVLRAFASGAEPEHPILDVPGWWQRSDRVVYDAVEPTEQDAERVVSTHVRPKRQLVITGARGTLGQAFARVCERRGLAFALLDRQSLDISDSGSVEQALQAFKPWGVVNAAGYCRVDDAERERDACHRDNTVGPHVLARACALRDLPRVTFSSDLGFDGQSRLPYRESDTPAPLCVYGLSKARAERDVLAVHPRALVVRTSAFFGPWDEYNFVTLTLRRLAEGNSVEAPYDLTVSPTYVPDLVNATLDLLIDGACGIWHLANQGATSWVDFGRRAADLRGYNSELVVPVAASTFGWPAARPVYSALGTERGAGLMPSLETALERYVAESQAV